MKHLIFYDDDCGFCCRAMRKVALSDKKHLFYYSPLHGELAKTLFMDKAVLPDYLVLVEDYQEDTRKFLGKGEAFFRICQLLGGYHAIVGLFGYFPLSWQEKWYKMVSKRRHSPTCSKTIPHDERFIP